MPRKCWAAALGGCDATISGEHIVSASILRELGNLTLQGFPWCKEKPQQVGAGSVTANVLCRTHNSELAPLDEAGLNAFRQYRSAQALFSECVANSSWSGGKPRFDIDGPAFERWMVKTTMNLVASGQTTVADKWDVTGEALSGPPDILVKVAFGLDTFPKPFGLYVAADVGEDLQLANSIALTTLIVPSGGLAGVGFSFRGHRLVLWLTGQPIPPRLDLPWHAEKAWRTGAVLYHHSAVRFAVKGEYSHAVVVNWPGIRISRQQLRHG